MTQTGSFEQGLRARAQLEDAREARNIAVVSMSLAMSRYDEALIEAKRVGLTTSEIARITGQTEAAVRHYIKRHALREKVNHG
jgi:predicted transcriptional regulator